MTLEVLKQLDEALGGELLVEPGGDLDHDRQVMSRGGGIKHRLQALKGQGAKMIDQPFRVEQAGV